MKCKRICQVLFMAVICLLPVTVIQAAIPNSIQITWSPVADAVTYELEITDQYFPAGASPTAADHLVKHLTMPTAGTQLVGDFLQNTNNLWWRVRGVDVLGNPLSTFSESQRLSAGKMNPEAPLALTTYPDAQAVPLYPAYSWIPVPGAAGYDVEVLSSTRPVQKVVSYHIDGGGSFDCYDWHSYTVPGTYSWRVRAVDGQSLPLGKWSAPVPFTVTTRGYQAAALGDSITHGGGAISSPPGTPMYDWTQSVTYPVKNLGRSGDTTAALLERFDQDVLPFAPKVLIIAGGINDIRDGTEASRIISNLRAIKQKCLARNITPVFVTLCPINPVRIATIIGAPLPAGWRDNWQTVNDWILSQPQAVDTVSLLANAQGLLPDQLSADGLHPDSEGKRLIGEAVSQKICELQNTLY